MLGLAQRVWFLLGSAEERKAFISVPALASAHEPALPVTQEKNCSPRASHHSHRKQSTFLTAFQIGVRWQQRKHKGTRGRYGVVPALPRARPA